MVAVVSIYLGMGLLTFLFLARRNTKDRNIGSGVGDLVLGILESPFAIVGVMVLWPLWLALELLYDRGLKIESEAKHKIETDLDIHRNSIVSPAIGESMVAISDLRPQGLVSFGQTRLEVFSESGHVSKGTVVLVTGYVDGSVKVRAM